MGLIIFLLLTLYGYIDNNSSLGIIGVNIGSFSGVINHVYPNSPAFSVGLAPGDRIIAVNGDFKDVMSKIDGIPYTSAYFTILKNKTRVKVKIIRVPVENLQNKQLIEYFRKRL